MTPSRSTILRRRAVAVVAAFGLGVLLWVLFAGGDEDTAGDAAPPPIVAPEAARLGGELSAEEQADQVLLLGFEGVDSTAPVVEELADRQVGGLVVDESNWLDAAGGAALVEALRSAGAERGRIRPLIVGTQEGGVYRSYADLPPEETELEIGDRGSPGRTATWARDTAEALRGSGFDLNLFPVADVATLDSPVADRAFSDDPGATAALTASALDGCAEGGLACAPLHFPGIGAASQDTAQGPATVSLDPASLAGRDLAPFRAAVDSKAPAMVVALAYYAAYDPVTPGALDPAVARGLLRDELGFEGAAITDDLSSGAVKATYRVPDAAVAALAAGSDMLWISKPEDQERVREAILAAVESGELPADRLAEAAGRVLELKRAVGIDTGV